MNPISSKQTGFTLIELLTVMLILVAMASVTIETTSELAFQNRFEVTKDRYEKIKQAIIGRPDVLINGQPDISGFVADMGRLPRNIHELLEEDYCLTDRTVTVQATCTALPGVWQDQNSNWKGPYLSITKDPSEANAFPDGWGNLPTAYCTNLNNTTAATCVGLGETWITEPENHNYGWYYFVDTTGPIDELHIFSLGKDHTFGGAAPDFDADYPSSLNHPNEPPVLNGNDWTVDIESLQASISTPSHGECLNAVCSDPTYSVYTNCIQPRSTWRVGVCSIDPSVNTTSASCTGASGAWTDLYGCSINPSVNTDSTSCTTAGGTWSTGVCSNPIYATQTSCQHARASWLGCDVNPDTELTLTTCSGNWTSAIENNCNKGGGQWTNSRDICFKVIRNGIASYPNISTISEDSQNHLIRYGTTLRVPIGNISLGIHPSDDTTCDANDDDVTYPATCINTGSHANFTQVNCETNNGQWLAGAIVAENSCSNMNTGSNGVLCSGTASPQLGGTWSNKDLLELKLVPNSTLPTVYW